MKLYYKDENVEILVCEVTTNHSMSVDDMLGHCNINMDDWADKQGWDGWDYGALEISNAPSIRELRTSTGMTQTEFGEYLNIPMRTIQNWEGGKRNCPKYLAELIEYKLEKEELVMKKCKEVLNKAREIMEGVYVQDIPELIIGDEVKLADVWDGNGEVPTESYSYQISDSEWINYEFEVLEENEDALETLIRITDISLV